MFFKKKKSDGKKIIKKYNGKNIKAITRRVEVDGTVKDEMVGKNGRVTLTKDNNITIINGTEDVFVCHESDTTCGPLMSGNGLIIKGLNKVNGREELYIVYFTTN